MQNMVWTLQASTFCSKVDSNDFLSLEYWSFALSLHEESVVNNVDTLFALCLYLFLFLFSLQTFLL